MKDKTVLFLGCGDIAIRAGRRLHATGCRLVGVRRSPGRLPPSFTELLADHAEPGALAALASLAPDYVVTTLTPAGRTEAGYRRGFLQATENLLTALAGHQPARILFVSSTRVYAEQEGGWVDEQSPLSESDPSARAIIDAEQLLLAGSCPASVVRCSGIYGDPHGRLLSRIAGGHLCPPEPVSFSNRIHRDDVAGFLVHLLCRDDAGGELAPVYNATDDAPAPQYEVEHWLAQRLGLAAEDLQYDAQRMVAGHKRCRNERLHASGYALAYPDYRAGYAQVLAARGS